MYKTPFRTDRSPRWPSRLGLCAALLTVLSSSVTAQPPQPSSVVSARPDSASQSPESLSFSSAGQDASRVLLTDRPAATATSSVAKPSADLNGGVTRSQLGGNESDRGPAVRPVSIAEALEKKGSVTFRKTSLSDAVFLLSELWHINIVAGENVSGEVNGAFHDAPLREVLSAALTATGYSYRQTGNSLIVLPIDQVGAEDPNFVSEVIRIPQSVTETDDAIEAAQLLLGDRGQLRKLGANTVLVVDTAERASRIARLFADMAPRSGNATDLTSAEPSAAATEPLEAVYQNGIAYFTPQFTEAEQMAEPLREALGENVVVAVYPEENRIMVKGTTEQLRLARDAIAQLDMPRQQVRITAMIYDVGLSELEKLGLNFSRQLRAVANAQNEALVGVTDSVSNTLSLASDLTTTGATKFGIRTINNSIAAGVFLEALDSTAEAKLLADPSITVADRCQASIRIVRKIPIVGANPVENSNAVFTQTEFEEAGVILNVKPRIGRDGTIELTVSPEYSVVAEITPTGPVIDSRTADTTVRVGNGQMFVLGGLRQKSLVESVRGVPYLKDVKFIGCVFRSHSTEIRESELIVFLKPELVTPYDAGTPREQRAACVAECELDAIPYADSVPQTPCCKDKYCPNHYPRFRINGGSRSLGMMGGYGIEGHYGQEQVIEERVIEDRPAELQAPAPAENLRPNLAVPPAPNVKSLPRVESVPQSGLGTSPEVRQTADGEFPPVHVDTAFSQPIRRF